MYLIAHRGNIFGPCPADENKPEYIQNAINMGFACEIDVWYLNDRLYLGHDEPQYEIEKSFLIDLKQYLWVHCKNMQAIKLMLDLQMNCFFHDKDTYTITSRHHIWGNIDSPIEKGMICVMPEKYTKEVSYNELMLCSGICSDYVYKYRLIK